MNAQDIIIEYENSIQKGGDPDIAHMLQDLKEVEDKEKI